MAQDFYLKVVRGNPTAEELAALITALSARAARVRLAAEEEVPAEAVTAWQDGLHKVRRPAVPSANPAAWRISGWAG
ncbi:acyl-CoA carboxylase subunit epsilon [Sphaerisporangium melleum]|uniref:acyl-CoA carboxylase subunit epsilon n=1 Tax=Sphaerisporangium melleum TaxID=321316 RepID=UPI0016640AA3|nr:acyl-CoA carboxylase subunit epsilon [Sphaerisporangium melleum]